MLDGNKKNEIIVKICFLYSYLYDCTVMYNRLAILIASRKLAQGTKMMDKNKVYFFIFRKIKSLLFWLMVSEVRVHSHLSYFFGPVVDRTSWLAVRGGAKLTTSGQLKSKEKYRKSSKVLISPTRAHLQWPLSSNSPHLLQVWSPPNSTTGYHARLQHI